LLKADAIASEDHRIRLDGDGPLFPGGIKGGEENENAKHENQCSPFHGSPIMGWVKIYFSITPPILPERKTEERRAC
jgi:hypothetical protein